MATKHDATTERIDKNKERTLRFTSKLRYDIDIDPNSHYRHGVYTENTAMNLFKTNTLGVPIDESSVDWLKQMKNRNIQHPNLMDIIAIDENTKFKCLLAIYGYQDHVTVVTAMIRKWVNPYNPLGFHSFVRYLVIGLRKLHLQGFYLGNLSLETIHFRRPAHARGTGGVIRLGEFRYNINDQKSDWISLAENVLLRMERDLIMKGYPNMLEFRHMCQFLRSPDLDMNISVRAMLGHPSFLKEEDRPFYIIDAVAFIKQKFVKKNLIVGIEEGYLKPVDSPKFASRSIQNLKISEPGDAEDLWRHLFSLGAVPPEDVRYTDGWRMPVIIRCCLSHHKKNANHDISQIIGKTMVEIESHFRRYQPEVVLELYKQASLKDFTFEKYHTLLPMDDEI